jgi:hypothetical protein
MKPLTEALFENSKSAIISCVELHNKPRFEYRYEIVIILSINAWGLLLNAYINENHSEVKLICRDGLTKPFEKCVKFVSSQKGKIFRVVEENLMKIYEYRNNIIHFYKDPIDEFLYFLLYKNILCRNLYSDFKQNAVFNRIMKNIKVNPKYHRKRFLDPVKKTGTAKDWYSQLVFEELNKNYTLKEKSA